MHSNSGVPIFKSKKYYTAIHPQTNQVIWKTERWALNKLGETLGGEASSSAGDFLELPFTFAALFGNSIVNVASGELLVDGEAEGIRAIESYLFIPSRGLLIVKLATKKGNKLYAIDVIRDKLKWGTLIDESSGVGQILGSATADGFDLLKKGLQPFIDREGHLIFKNGKSLISILPESGKINWRKKTDPGQLLFSEDGKLLAIAKERSDIGAMMGVATSLQIKLSKKLMVIDNDTGKDVWKKEKKMDGNILFLKNIEDGLGVVHDGGVNIYDYNSGEKRWKNDIKVKGIVDVQLEEAGLMVYNANKRQLFDLKKRN